MMMTALVTDKYNMDFATVHDSYWTHACEYRNEYSCVGDVDQMNEMLRDQLESLVIRYPDVSFPPIPEKGKLDLESVRNSPYFFN